MNTPNNAAAAVDRLIEFVKQADFFSNESHLAEVAEQLATLRATLAQPDALTSQPSGGTAAADRFEQYVATLINKNPDVRRLGERLADWLDEDRFNTVNPILLGICERLATHPSADAPGVNSSLRVAALALADLAERNTDDLDLWEAAIAAVRNAVDAPGVAVDAELPNGHRWLDPEIDMLTKEEADRLRR